MSPKYGNWLEYQEAAAEVFRELGCRAEVEKTITGARGTHKIDVYVKFSQFGYDCRWIVECKLTSRPVSKADVLTFYGIAQDVGADRGFMFCESGFQSGAHTAVRNTNIRLHTSLEDFRQTARLNMTRIPLVHKESDEPDAPPVHLFPHHYQPHHLLKHEGRVFVGNWGTPQAGNIAIVDPETRSIEGIINLDKYEDRRSIDSQRIIRQYPPGNMACADGKLFVGQVFSKVVLVVDIDTQSIINRIEIPGGGEGSISASPDGRHIYFASNQVNCLFVIDSATYEYEAIDYPQGGRGSLCILPHPSKPLLYISIQRGGNLDGISYPGGNCFLAVYDLAKHQYIGNLYLAEVESGRSDDSTPICLTYDEDQTRLFVGMFQSLRGICLVDELGQEILENFRFAPNARNKHFRWVDPLSQALYRDKLLSINRNNRELVTLNKLTGRTEHSAYLGEAPNGPHSVVVVNDVAIISYPQREGLIFHDLAANG